MRYWWVNQNQTFEQERRGGYLWSPKFRKDGARNQFYENMREVAPGDVIFSFHGQVIAAIAVAKSNCFDFPKPTEFGSTGAYWDSSGWRVDVDYRIPHKKVRPADHMELLRPLLPERYAPLQQSGRGLQGVYLAELPKRFAEVLAGLIGIEAQELVAGSHDIVAPVANDRRPVDEWEDHIQRALISDKKIDSTEKTALIRARRGQGRFKDNVMAIEEACRITKVSNPTHLIASHIKPWRNSSNEERLDGENGLLLTPTIDHLFDRGFISFERTGRLLISPVADVASLQKMGIRHGDDLHVGDFSSGQKKYLEFHRESVFLQISAR